MGDGKLCTGPPGSECRIPDEAILIVTAPVSYLLGMDAFAKNETNYQYIYFYIHDHIFFLF